MIHVTGIIMLGLMLYWSIFYSLSDCNVIKIEDGELLGETLFTDSGKEYEVYRKIPFAKPPIGSLRFQPPEPPEPWYGIRNATEPSTMCIQNGNVANRFDMVIVGEEDCLYIEVYKPKNISKLLPVMVGIHGGAFRLGSNSMCDPVYFMDHEIIAVFFHYRLHVLGFLSTNDEVLPGNIGMKDQVAALKWIQKNIAAFGGNPKSVTLLGNSAGAVSVHYHLFSPLSKGLFHRAVCQSGSSFIPSVFSTAERVKKKTIILAETVGCPTESSQKLIECLRKVPAKLLTAAHEDIYGKYLKNLTDIAIPDNVKKEILDLWSFNPLVLFPIVGEPPHEDAFITEFPQHIVNNVPVIMGMNPGDGSAPLSDTLNNPRLFEIMQKNLTRIFPYIFTCNCHLRIENEEELFEAAESLLNYYFHGEKFGLETLNELVELFTDGFFGTVPLTEAAKIQKETAYFYLYEHRNEQSFSDEIFNFPQIASSTNYNSHADDLISFCHLPGLKFSKLKNVSNDYHVSQKMIKYWINFANTGNPNNEFQLWKPVTSNEIEYLRITSFEDKMEKGLRGRSYNLWKKLNLIPYEQKNNLRDEF